MIRRGRTAKCDLCPQLRLEAVTPNMLWGLRRLERTRPRPTGAPSGTHLQAQNHLLAMCRRASDCAPMEVHSLTSPGEPQATWGRCGRGQRQTKPLVWKDGSGLPTSHRMLHLAPTRKGLACGRADPKAGPCDTDTLCTFSPHHGTAQAPERGRASQRQPPTHPGASVGTKGTTRTPCSGTASLQQQREGETERASSGYHHLDCTHGQHATKVSHGPGGWVRREVCLRTCCRPRVRGLCCLQSEIAGETRGAAFQQRHASTKGLSHSPRFLETARLLVAGVNHGDFVKCRTVC